jgi:predicted nucleotidyltransferase
VINPVNHLARLRDSIDKISDLEQVSINLIEKLVRTTEIGWSNIGLTGSQLVGVARKDSDIDLVIYGSDTCHRFYSNLSRNIESISGFERYSGSLLDEHVSFRWGAHEKLRSILRNIEQTKVLQGLFEGYHFFVRLVKTLDDLDYVYGDISYQMKSQVSVSGKVIDDIDSIFTPCEYLVECDNFPDLRKLVSYRGRFTEQISKGMYFEALGRLEIVTDHKEKEQYMQLVLGERPTDYLIPV